MAEKILCARHGITEKVWNGLCGEKLLAVDRDNPDPNRLAFRKAMKIPTDLCGRLPLDFCPACEHPKHGTKCHSIKGYVTGSSPATVWCDCKQASPA